MSKATDLRKLSAQELKTKALEINEELFKINMQTKLGTVKDRHAIVSKRRELARVYTVLTEKSGGAN